MSPTVSIIIPMFNAEKHIYQCLYSCVNQTFQDIEIVAVDDGSTDRSMEIVESLDDKRIRCVRFGSNQGTASARNAGIASALGQYVALLDSDDMLTHDSVEMRLMAFQQIQGVHIVGGYAYVIHDDGSTKYYEKRSSDLRIRTGKFFVASSPMIRKSIPISYWFDKSIRLNEDREFWGRVLIDYRLPAIKLAMPVCYHRIHGGSKMRTADIDERLAEAVAYSGPALSDVIGPLHLINWGCIDEDTRKRRVLGQKE